MRGLWPRAGDVEARCNAIYTIEVLGVSCHSNNHSLTISMDGVASLVESVSLQCCDVLELLDCTWCFCSVETKAICVYLSLSVRLTVTVIRCVVLRSDIVLVALYLWTLFPLQDFSPACKCPTLMGGILDLPIIIDQCTIFGPIHLHRF